jgi:hypothetical protein
MNGVMFQMIQVWHFVFSLQQACTACCVVRETAARFGVLAGNMKFSTLDVE